MPESFTIIAIYAVAVGMMLATFFFCGIYLIHTEYPLKKPDFKANIPVRKLGGWILIALGCLYIYSSRLVAYLPEWGHKNPDLWGQYIQQDALLYMIVCFPFFFLFIFNMVEKVRKEQIVNILIPVIAPTVVYILFCIHPAESLYFSSISFWVAYMSIMCVLYIRRVINYEKRILEQHSNIENRLLWRFWWPFGIFITTMVGGILLGIYEGNFILLIIHIILNIGCTLTLVWSVDNLEGDVEELSIEESLAAEFENLDDYSKRRIENLGKELKKALAKEPFYLKPNFSSHEMAAMLNTNRTYLGQYFHYQNTNFYIFINTLRIEYACKLMEKQKTNLNDIALLSGFNSPKTFRRVFEDIKGCLPSEWKANGGGGKTL